jgi:hypothetical protein
VAIFNVEILSVEELCRTLSPACLPTKFSSRGRRCSVSNGCLHRDSGLLNPERVVLAMALIAQNRACSVAKERQDSCVNPLF